MIPARTRPAGRRAGIPSDRARVHPLARLDALPDELPPRSPFKVKRTPVATLIDEPTRARVDACADATGLAIGDVLRVGLLHVLREFERTGQVIVSADAPIPFTFTREG